jgi:hypothetical protein
MPDYERIGIKLPERELLCAVIAAAVRDLRSNQGFLRSEAMQFFILGSSPFWEYCHHLNLPIPAKEIAEMALHQQELPCLSGYLPTPCKMPKPKQSKLRSIATAGIRKTATYETTLQQSSSALAGIDSFLEVDHARPGNLEQGELFLDTTTPYTIH